MQAAQTLEWWLVFFASLLVSVLCDCNNTPPGSGYCSTNRGSDLSYDAATNRRFSFCSANCDFTKGLCFYVQGCNDTRVTEWRVQNGSATAEQLEGGCGMNSFSILESHWIDIPALPSVPMMPTTTTTTITMTTKTTTMAIATSSSYSSATGPTNGSATSATPIDASQSSPATTNATTDIFTTSTTVASTATTSSMASTVDASVTGLSTANVSTIASTTGATTMASTTGSPTMASTTGASTITSTTNASTLISTANASTMASTTGWSTMASTANASTMTLTTGALTMASTTGASTMASSTGASTMISTANASTLASMTNASTMASTIGASTVASTANASTMASTTNGSKVIISVRASQLQEPATNTSAATSTPADASSTMKPTETSTTDPSKANASTTEAPPTNRPSTAKETMTSATTVTTTTSTTATTADASCLRFAFFPRFPSTLDVFWISETGTITTLLNKSTQEKEAIYREEYSLTKGLGKLQFRLYGGGGISQNITGNEEKKFLALHYVSLQRGSCLLPACNFETLNSSYVMCGWRNENWQTFNRTENNTAISSPSSHIKSTSTLTTQIIRPTLTTNSLLPKTTDCLKFQYVVNGSSDVTLSMSVWMMNGQWVTLWKQSGNDSASQSWGDGSKQWRSGAVPINSPYAYAVVFESSTDSPDDFVGLDDVMMTSTSGSCPLEPDGAKVDSISNVTEFYCGSQGNDVDLRTTTVTTTTSKETTTPETTTTSSTEEASTLSAKINATTESMTSAYSSSTVSQTSTKSPTAATTTELDTNATTATNATIETTTSEYSSSASTQVTIPNTKPTTATITSSSTEANLTSSTAQLISSLPSNQNAKQGISEKQENDIIIGVVVGVGGFLIVAVVVYALYRKVRIRSYRMEKIDHMELESSEEIGKFDILRAGVVNPAFE